MADKYRVASSHPEDLASGATFAPGQIVKGLDRKHPHDKALIADGRLVRVESTKSSTTKEDQK